MNLDYRYQMVSGDRESFLSYNSTSIDRRFYKLPPYYLAAGATYGMSVTVTDMV